VRGPGGTDARRRLTAWSLVGVGVLGVSLSGPLAADVAVPALAVAFWRTALGALATAPVAAVLSARARGGPRPGLRAPAAAGLLLAVHFGTWIPSLRLTDVATSTALVTTSPLWIVLLRRVRGEPEPRAVVLGSVLAVAGVLVVTGADLGGSGRALAGDLLALAGGAAGAAYTMVGEHARRTTSTATYTLVVYAVCAAVLVPVCLLGGVPLAGWDGAAWGQLLLLTVVAQLLGHTAFNAAVPVVGATPLALAILLEVPGATLVAWAWLGQVPPVATVPGLLAVLAGLALVVRARW
jgi:drug/metabolite transporter (DMT)-like permease